MKTGMRPARLRLQIFDISFPVPFVHATVSLAVLKVLSPLPTAACHAAPGVRIVVSDTDVCDLVADLCPDGGGGGDGRDPAEDPVGGSRDEEAAEEVDIWLIRNQHAVLDRKRT